MTTFSPQKKREAKNANFLHSQNCLLVMCTKIEIFFQSKKEKKNSEKKQCFLTHFYRLDVSSEFFTYNTLHISTALNIALTYPLIIPAPLPL